MWIETHTKGINLDSVARSRIEQQLQDSLGHHATRIRNTSVYLRDTNGPRGGPGQQCRIVVHLPRCNRIVVSGSGTQLFPLIKRTAERTSFAVRRHFNRRRSGMRRQDQHIAA
jgi:hypothetical protein